MTTLATEVWSGASGAALPSQWTVTAASGGSATQSGAAYATFNPGASGSYLDTYAYLSGMTSATDTDVTGWFSHSTLTESYQFVSVRATSAASASGANYYTSTGYSFMFYAVSGGNLQLTIAKAGVEFNSTGQTATKAAFLTANGQVNYRVRVTGSTSTLVQVRTWIGSTEPTSWDVSFTDSASPQTAAGRVRIGSNNAPGRFGALTVTDAATGAATAALTFTVTTEPAATPPRVRIDVNDTRTTPATSLTLVRLNPDGSRTPVRTPNGGALTLTGGRATVYDYEVPYAAPVAYTSVEVPATITGQVTLPVAQAWLVHPGIPALSQPLNLAPTSLQTETRAIKQGVFYVLGDPNPAVVNDGSRKSPSSQVVVQTETLDDLDEMLTLISDGSTLLLNIPASQATGFDAQYISIADVTVARTTEIVIDDDRNITLPFVVTRRPAGGTTATRTYAVAEAQYATYTTARAAYSTYAAATGGP